MEFFFSATGYFFCCINILVQMSGVFSFKHEVKNVYFFRITIGGGNPLQSAVVLPFMVRFVILSSTVYMWGDV